MHQEKLPKQAFFAKANERRPVEQPSIENLGWNRLGLHQSKMMDMICIFFKVGLEKLLKILKDSKFFT